MDCWGRKATSRIGKGGHSNESDRFEAGSDSEFRAVESQ